MCGLNRFLIVALSLVTLCLLSACEHKPSGKAAQPPTVTVALPVSKEVTKYLEYTGTTAALQSVQIRARVAGFLEKITFTPRAKVKAGELLFVIDPRQYQASVNQSKAQLESQKAHSKLAQTELQIAQSLESKEAISGLKLEKKGAERDVAKADVDLAAANLDTANLNLEWTQVTSPIDGRVSRNLVDVGNLVGATEKTLLTTVVDDESVYAYFNVSELDLLSVRRKGTGKRDPTTDLPMNFPVFLALADETGFPHEGRLDFAQTQIDPSTGTIQVRGIFPNTDGTLMAGMFVRVRVPVEKREALLVPDVAVQFDQGGRYLLLVDDRNVVHHKRIKMGQQVDDMRVIEEGITATDRVIIAGTQRARPGSTVNPTPAPGAQQRSESTIPVKTQHK
ncbi:MAG: efflux RND transporter periplasmic adaptor subunit [Desulfomonile tiedjei]|nr:efflux RND transporter periplasmic adaptor subunit [Desulfomonile tiedjei]